jgi:folate-binding protein YgfZ
MDAPPALIDRSARTRLLVTGPDRAKLLHNLTTQDVLNLKTGEGCEAFVTSPQGKTLAWVTIHALPDAILVRGESGVIQAILPHFQKYGPFDDVTWTDRGRSTFEWHLVGPLRVDSPYGDLGINPGVVAGKSITLIREAPAGEDGWTLIGEASEAEAIGQEMRYIGAVSLPPDEFEAMRIEAGTPGPYDVTPENLPQEFERDARAISFKKGCYLGQETVARLDALGHVSRFLRGFRVEGDEVLAPGAPLQGEGGKVVGKLTSTAYSQRFGSLIGLGVVRTKLAAPGTLLTTYAGRRVVVSALPMRPN